MGRKYNLAKSLKDLMFDPFGIGALILGISLSCLSSSPELSLNRPWEFPEIIAKSLENLTHDLIFVASESPAGVIVAVIGVVYSLFVTWFIGIVAVFLCLRFINQIGGSEFVKKYERCPHGIRGGIRRYKCDHCAKEFALEMQKWQNEDSQRQEKNARAYKVRQFHEEQINKVFREIAKEENALLSVHPKDFESFVAKLFKDMGFEVAPTPYSNDGGYDAVVLQNGKKYLVECKKYKKNKIVPVKELRAFYGVMVAQEADGGYFVTTGQFSSQGMRQFSNRQITFSNLTRLIQMIHGLYGANKMLESVQGMCDSCGGVLDFKVSDGDDKIIRCDCGKEIRSVVLNDPRVAQLIKIYNNTKM